MTNKVLKQHTDRFSLYKNARKGRQNGRKYVLSAVKSMIESAETQEAIRLGEAFGYYGHDRRILTGRLDVPETAVIMVEGKPVVIDNVPGCRTIALSVDDEGTVTHTQEIFDNEPGRIIAGLLESRAGGWSWATSGRDSPSASIPTTYYGMDYVRNPNFISLDHPANMYESAEDQQIKMLEGLQSEGGFSEDGAMDVLAHFAKIGAYEAEHGFLIRAEEAEAALFEARGQILELEQQHAEADSAKQTVESMLEGVKADHQMQLEGLNNELNALKEQISSGTATMDARREFVSEMLESLPVFVTETQREAMLNMASDEDLDTVKGLFESIRKASLNTLPLDKKQVTPPPASAGKPTVPVISFAPPTPQF